MQNPQSNIMQCQITNCSEPITHTRVETLHLDDESCEIITNLCRLHTLVVTHHDSDEYNIIKT